jgi:hypothetical protein
MATQRLIDCDQHPVCALIVTEGVNDRGEEYRLFAHVQAGDPFALANQSYPLRDELTRPVSLPPLDTGDPPVELPAEPPASAKPSLISRVLSVF